jgi:hypothetical protein
MNPLIQLRKATPLFLVALACFALSPASRAVDPSPDGGYPGANTAEGEDALFSLTSGVGNTATGFQALRSNTTGVNNTATGNNVLFSNTVGGNNTASGIGALQNNTTGSFNTADGVHALFNNSMGASNIALGFNAGVNLTTGNSNIDIGAFGVAGEARTIRIGVQGTQTRTFVAAISGSPIAGTSVVVNSVGRSAR